MQKPHMANRALAAIADCEFRGRGCGFVGVRGGGLGTVAAGWWRATGAAAATRPVIEPPGAPTGARLCSQAAICGPAMCGNAAHTKHLPNPERAVAKKLKLSFKSSRIPQT